MAQILTRAYKKKKKPLIDRFYSRFLSISSFFSIKKL